MYILDRIANKADGTLKKSVYEYDSIDEAKGNTYVYFGTDIKDETVLSINCLLHETNGTIVENLYWQGAPVVEEPVDVATE